MTLHFDSRDLFRCVRLGWSGKKIWIGLMGLVLAWVGYSVLVVIAHWHNGMSVSALWHQYGLFPGAPMGAFGLLGTLLHLLAMVWVVAVVLVMMCMMCKITFQQLRGDEFYSSGDAWAFAKKHGSAVLFGPLGALALFLFFVVAGIVMGWVAGWIPVLGEWVFALGFLPIFFVSLLAVFIAIVFLFSISLSPAIVGTVGEDALEVVIQSFSLVWSQPWRLVLYLAWVKVSAWVGIFVLSALSLASVWLITWSCGLFMDLKLANMFDVATQYMPFVPKQWALVLANLPNPGVVAGAEQWSGRILGLMLVAITGIILAYGFAAHASGWTLVYVVLRRFKDGENMLEWEMDDWGQVDFVDENAASNEEHLDEDEGEPEPIKEEQDDSTKT